MEVKISNGPLVPLQPSSPKKFKGIRLPGAELCQWSDSKAMISVHEYTQKLFGLSLRSFSSSAPVQFTVKELSHYIRLETVLQGELYRSEHGKNSKLIAGQYQLVDVKNYTLTLNDNRHCVFLVVFLSPELIGQTQLNENLVAGEVRTMTAPMRGSIQKITDNIFEERLRDAFYEHTVRELLFYHIAAPDHTLPGDLSADEIAKVYEADNIIAADLSKHYSTQQLAKMVHTNAQVLKTGFARLFGMGTFERLVQRKMEKAKFLLETTDKQIQQISLLAGYETVTGFINAFRRQFKVSPKDWRKKSRGL